MTVVDPTNQAPSWDEPLLARFIARDTPNCPMCRHRLRLSAGDCCAHCGEELTLSVGAESSRLGLFITGLVALAGAVGFGLMICAIGLAAHLNSSVREFWPFYVFGGGALVSSVGIALWIRFRRRFRAAPVGKRILLTMLTGLPPIALFYFTMVID